MFIIYYKFIEKNKQTKQEILEFCFHSYQLSACLRHHILFLPLLFISISFFPSNNNNNNL